MRIERIVVGQLAVNCYVVSCEETRRCVIIDPGDEPERIIEYLDRISLAPDWIVLTHGHYDHACGLRELRDIPGSLFAMHADEQETYESTRTLCMTWGYDAEDFPPPDRLLAEDDFVSAGSVRLKVLHTPGHTAGSICLSGNGILFTGDTLFAAAVGRTDLPGGDPQTLRRSVGRLLQLAGGTVVLSGHGEQTTIAEERIRNPFSQTLKFRDRR